MQANQSPEVLLQLVALRAWKLFKSDPLFFLLGGVVVLVGGGLSFTLLLGPLLVTFVDGILRRGRGEVISLKDLFWRDMFASAGRFFAAIFTFVVFIIAVSVGYFYFVLPGLVAALFLMFVFHALASGAPGVWAAIGRSVTLVKNNPLVSVLLFVALVLLNSIGSLLIVLSLLTFPFSIILLTVAFTELQPASSAS